jgi:hypothetical protein
MQHLCKIADTEPHNDMNKTEGVELRRLVGAPQPLGKNGLLFAH